MSDLSQLLGAVYDDGDSGPSPVSIGAPARQPVMATTAPASMTATVTAIPAVSPLAALNAALAPAPALDPPANEDAASSTPDVAVASASEPRRVDPPGGATTARSPFADALDAGPTPASTPSPPAHTAPATDGGLSAHGQPEPPPASGDKKNGKSNGKAKNPNATVDASLPHAPPEPPPVHDDLRPWRREDDDILPVRPRKRLFSRG